MRIKPPFNAAVERLAGGLRWAEGPVWFGDGRYLLCSDIPNNRIMRWDEETGAIGVFRRPSHHANGNTRDRQGRLVTCEHETRRVTRTEYDGAITVILDRFEGKRLNSPNDVVVKSDDSIWFTDPPFGILGNYEGERASPELPTNVYRVDGKTGRAAVVAGDLNGPNGLCFSPDEAKLYVVESRAVPRQIRVFDVVDDGARLANGRVFVSAGDGTPDGFRCDVHGNLWCGWGMTSSAQRGRRLCPRRDHDRHHRAARTLRQSVLWRTQAQPPADGRQPVDLFGLRQHRRRCRRLTGRGALCAAGHRPDRLRQIPP